MIIVSTFNFTFNESIMNTETNNVNRAKELIESSLKISKQCLKNIDCSKVWAGESHETMKAFMSLTIKYHKKFACNESAIAQAATSLKKACKDSERFYSNSKCYRNLRRI